MMEPLDACDTELDAEVPPSQSASAQRDGHDSEPASAHEPQPHQQKQRGGWSGAYSSALTKSMKAMISGHRLARSSASAHDNVSASAATGRNDAGYTEQAFQRLLAAIANKEKEEIIDVVTQSPQVLRMTNEELGERLPLHLVCALIPNYFFTDVIEMMVKGYDESSGCMDKLGQTPLHMLCNNPSVTCQAIHVLISALPACVAMCDKSSNLPLHYLCLNGACEVDMVRELGTKEIYGMKNSDLRTPLHCLAMSPNVKKSSFVYLLSCCPDAVDAVDMGGRSVLHWVCDMPDLNMSLLEQVLNISTDSACKKDKNGDLPLHLLCQNDSIQPEMLRQLVARNPDGVNSKTQNGATPLHFLCANESVSPDLLTDFFMFDKRNTAANVIDDFGASPLHLLCMNASTTPAHLRALLLMCNDDALLQDVHGRSPLHYVCMNRLISAELLWLFFERASDLVRQIDKDGKTPLHHICCNPSVSSVVLEIMFDAWPSAAMVADKEMKLPVQLLVDNPTSVPEISALLISGPSSYRLRYDFLSITPQCVSFTSGSELVYVQTNYAIDSKSATKVMMKFFSSATLATHEENMLLRLQQASTSPFETSAKDKDFTVKIIDAFDDAKKRVTLRNPAIAPEDQTGFFDCSDTPVILNHALVTEAPAYHLDGLKTEKLDDMVAIKAIISEVAECLLFWHKSARMVHGNITLESIGYSTDHGLKLFNFGASRELDQLRSIGMHAIDPLVCPPEAARAFLGNAPFLPTPASDMWQFGCLVFLLATGQSVIERLCPWSKLIGYEQMLHLISAVEETTLNDLIEGAPAELQSILQHTLVLNPHHRWRIDRIMNASCIAVVSDLSDTTATEGFAQLNRKLQRHADGLIEGLERERSAKHAQDQLDFMKKEQATLRHTLVRTKTQLREAEEKCGALQTEVQQLQVQLANATHQKDEAKLEAQVFAHNHQSMTHQLHTTVQMLLNLVPLARKVYGAGADEFLSGVLSQAAGAELGPVPTGMPPMRRRRKSAMQVMKSRLQKSRFAYGCVNTWANSNSNHLGVAGGPSANGDGDEDKYDERHDDTEGVALFASDEEDGDDGNALIADLEAAITDPDYVTAAVLCDAITGEHFAPVA